MDKISKILSVSWCCGFFCVVEGELFSFIWSRGRGGTPQYKPYRCKCPPPQMVVFSLPVHRFGLKRGIDFAHFGSFFCCCSNLSNDHIISERPCLKTGGKNDIFLALSRVRIWITWRHTPTKDSQEYPSPHLGHLVKLPRPQHQNYHKIFFFAWWSPGKWPNSGLNASCWTHTI